MKRASIVCMLVWTLSSMPWALPSSKEAVKPTDRSATAALLVEALFYPDDARAVLSVTCRQQQGLPQGADLVADLIPEGKKEALQTHTLGPAERGREAEAEFSLGSLAPGRYLLRAFLRVGGADTDVQAVPFRYPFELPSLPDPRQAAALPLPAGVAPPSYQFHLAETGGFAVTVNGTEYPIESTYSYPHGGENRLGVRADGTDGERSWSVKTARPDDKSYRVTAGGQYYDIERAISLEPSRVLIRDTVRNKWNEVLGVVLSNRINLRQLPGAEVTRVSNPSIFASAKGSGVGLLALDDLYQLQQRNGHANGIAEVRTEHFGLDRGASYTVEWAVYPTGTADYYDFINQVQKDEGTSTTIEGTCCLIGVANQVKVPSREFIELRKARYLIAASPWHPVDDPGVSLEGFEFIEYPKECARLRESLAEIKRLYPQVKVMFHVAPNLYATSRPADRFSDSLAKKPNGKPDCYGDDTAEYYGRYFSKERVGQGWRWWAFYPTPENSFGKLAIKATEYMLDQIGATGMWGDGFFRSYVDDGYTYDRWDGHSVTIDPKTKLVTAKKTCVPWVALPVLKRICQMINAKGGCLLVYDHPGSRAFWRENYIPALYLGRAVTPREQSGAMRSERDIYRAMLNKLDSGNLWFWYYQDNVPLTHKTLVEHMYPITIESIHRGTVRGKERIVTRKTGVYGWHGDRSLHRVHLYDARGALTRSAFVTTVDQTGVRTQVDLQEMQSAVVEKIPVTASADAPLNVRVERYGLERIQLGLNGKGNVELAVRNGAFPVKTGSTYRVSPDGTRTIQPEPDGVLRVAVSIDGPSKLTIDPAPSGANAK